jgi:acyl dehydratase
VTMVVDREIWPPAGVCERYADASGDHDPIHVDDVAARAAGLSGRILHGLWTMAQVARVGQELAEADPWALQEAFVEFRAPAEPGRPLTITGSGTAEALSLEVFQGGRRVIANARLELVRQTRSL